jgi:hypothetical protein
MGVNFDEIFSKIKDTCIKTLMAVESEIVTASRSTKFKG